MSGDESNSTFFANVQAEADKLPPTIGMMSDKDSNEKIEKDVQQLKFVLQRGDRVMVNQYDGRSRTYSYHFSGTFQEFGTDHEEYETGIGQIPVALVMNDEGKMHVCHAKLINKVFE